MANIEGAVRMRKAGKLTILAGLACFVLAVLLLGIVRLFAPLHSPMMVFPGIALLCYPGFWLELIGAILWLSGWIVEGFLSPRGPQSGG
jgi:hypothetical protein